MTPRDPFETKLRRLVDAALFVGGLVGLALGSALGVGVTYWMMR